MTVEPFAERIYRDGLGHASVMCWVPPFTVAIALSERGAEATRSGTPGDWFRPETAPPGAIEGRDYDLVAMGGWFVDKYLCSAVDASAEGRGTVADGSPASPHYVSRAGVAPMVDRDIGHFKTGLAARFAGGAFDGIGRIEGQGGLIPDVFWNQLWVWGRLAGLAFHGNSDHGRCYLDRREEGRRDPTTAHGTLTGSGPPSWRLPLDDFTGNRAEFTDGLRLLDGVVFTAGRRIDPPNAVRDPAYLDTGLRIGGVAPYDSVASYRTEPALREHSIGASGVPGGTGPMDGQGLFYELEGERVADRGSGWSLRELAPGKLSLGKSPQGFGDRVGARAVFLPE